MKGNNALIQAQHNFETLTNFKFTNQVVLENESKKTTDFIFTLHTKNKEICFDGQFIEQINRRNLPFVISHLELQKIKNKNAHEILIITEYVSEEIGIELVNKNIYFLDAVGNAYMKQEDIFIWIAGKKKQKLPAIQKNKAFQASGIKFLLYLLSEPSLINLPNKEIANKTEISPTILRSICKNLEELDYIITLQNKEKAIINRKKMLGKLLISFQEKLLPTLQPRCFYIKDIHQIELNDDIIGGGELAGSLQTDYLFPEKIILYTKIDVKELMLQYRLIPDKKGNVEIRHLFWKETLQAISPVLYTTPPLLTYIDLITSENNRNIETAQIIYDKYLSNFFDGE